jgi:hypothetical protein
MSSSRLCHILFSFGSGIFFIIAGIAWNGICDVRLASLFYEDEKKDNEKK